MQTTVPILPTADAICITPGTMGRVGIQRSSIKLNRWGSTARWRSMALGILTSVIMTMLTVISNMRGGMAAVGLFRRLTAMEMWGGIPLWRLMAWAIPISAITMAKTATSNMRGGTVTPGSSDNDSRRGLRLGARHHNTPHIATMAKMANLKYARWDGDGWPVQIVDAVCG